MPIQTTISRGVATLFATSNKKMSVLQVFNSLKCLCSCTTAIKTNLCVTKNVHVDRHSKTSSIPANRWPNSRYSSRIMYQCLT